MPPYQVKIVSKQLVKPSYPTPDSLKHLKLPFHGQILTSIGNYIPLIFFYEADKLSIKTDHHQKSQQLKQSLSEALTKFYPFAGRISGSDSVHCNDSGALYVEAQDRADLSEAIQNANTEDLRQYLLIESHPTQRSNDKSNYVLLAVQIGFFECGGMAVGVCLSHAVADAHSLVTFMNVWAEICSGRTEKYMQPNFDMASNHFPPFEMWDFKSGDILREHHSSRAEEKIVMKRFVFDKNMLSTMKKLVSSSSRCHDPTRVETVSAFIWKHFIDIARAKSHDTKKPFVACHALNLRSRVTPPLPDYAMGNMSTVIGRAALFQSENSRDYFNLVPLLRTAIRNVPNNYIKVSQGSLEYVELLDRGKPDNRHSCHSCVFSSLCRFPIYEVDYGWGKPLSACTGARSNKNTVILMDTRYGDGIQAWISMVEDEMAMLPDEFLALESIDTKDAVKEDGAEAEVKS